MILLNLELDIWEFLFKSIPDFFDFFFTDIHSMSALSHPYDLILTNIQAKVNSFYKNISNYFLEVF